MSLRYAPAGWPVARVDAFNTLLDAIEAAIMYRNLLAALNITDPVLLQRRSDLDQLIIQQLLPAFKNA